VGAAAGERETALEVTNWPALIGSGLGLILASFLCASLYYQAMVLGMQEGGPIAGRSLAGFFGQVLMNWLRICGYFLLLGFGALLLGLPALLVVVAIAFVSPQLAALLLVLAITIAASWFGLFLFFAIQAMFVNNVDPLRGIWYSYNVVQ